MNAVKLLLINALEASHKYWNVLLLFSFSLKYFLISILICSLTYGLLEVCYYQIFVDFSEIFYVIDFYFYSIVDREYTLYDLNTFIFLSHLEIIWYLVWGRDLMFSPNLLIASLTFGLNSPYYFYWLEMASLPYFKFLQIREFLSYLPFL